MKRICAILMVMMLIVIGAETARAGIRHYMRESCAMIDLRYSQDADSIYSDSIAKRVRNHLT